MFLFFNQHYQNNVMVYNVLFTMLVLLLEITGVLLLNKMYIDLTKVVWYM